MLGDYKWFFLLICTLTMCVLLPLSWLGMFIAIPFPWNVLTVFATLTPLFYLNIKEWNRIARLGKAHDRLSEIPESQQKAAMDYLERMDQERKKTRSLPTPRTS